MFKGGSLWGWLEEHARQDELARDDGVVHEQAEGDDDKLLHSVFCFFVVNAGYPAKGADGGAEKEVTDEKTGQATKWTPTATHSPPKTKATMRDGGLRLNQTADSDPEVTAPPESSHVAGDTRAG